jgi:hypothetical protein
MSNRSEIVNKLQERIQELVEQREKINQEINFNQRAIAELYRKSYSSSSELLSNDNISIEYIPKIKEETKGKVKKDTMKKIKTPQITRAQCRGRDLWEVTQACKEKHLR